MSHWKPEGTNREMGALDHSFSGDFVSPTCLLSTGAAFPGSLVLLSFPLLVSLLVGRLLKCSSRGVEHDGTTVLLLKPPKYQAAEQQAIRVSYGLWRLPHDGCPGLGLWFSSLEHTRENQKNLPRFWAHLEI